MKRSTLLTSVLVFLSLNLLWMPTPVLAQHGGGHAGGGGGRAGGGGGFHGGGGSYGGVHSGGYSGGGYRGGAGSGVSAGRGLSGGMRGEAPGARSWSAGHPWSWEGHSSRDSSPGWHQFANGTGAARSAGGSVAARPGESTIARPGSMASHVAVADGNWHSFNSVSRTAGPTRVSSVTRSTVFTNNLGWHGGYWGGWRGSWGFGWGWPGWNWGFGWGCCGWGWGWGFGWGWGWWRTGWSTWAPFWAWPPYYYNPWFDNSWLYGDSSPAPYVLDPYPA